MENAYLIVGLGNPGPEYAGTRHNAGFMLLDRLVGRWAAQWKPEKKFRAIAARVERQGIPVHLCQPQTYMNCSGESVVAMSKFYRVAVGRMMVAVDDADLPLGEIRLRPQGSSGGHRGIESIERHLNTREFARLRIGIGRRVAGQRELADYVLGRFDGTEMPLLEKVLGRAADQVECWLGEGIAKAMSQFNGVVKDAV